MSDSLIEAARRLRRINDMRSNFGKDKAPQQEDTQDMRDTAQESPPVKVEISEWVDLLESKDGKVWLTFERNNLEEVVEYLGGLIDEC